MSSVYVSELAIYPVKSLAQIVLSESRVDNFGLENDRRWMLVDHQGHFITQRQQSRMCLIQVKLLNVKSQLNGIELSAPQMPPLVVAVPSTRKSVLVTIWHDQCHVVDCGREVSEWLSEFLSVKCKLVFFTEDDIRQVDQSFAKPGDLTTFSDGFPLLLISQASLENLNSKLETAVPMKRFRPNLVVCGCNAFEEDNWKQLRIGDLLLRVVKPCSRCVIPSINTDTGERGSEPTKTLLTFRKRDSKIFFGQNVIANSPGHISVGDLVEILD